MKENTETVMKTKTPSRPQKPNNSYATTIRVMVTTHDRLAKHATFGVSMDDVLNELLNHYENCKINK